MSIMTRHPVMEVLAREVIQMMFVKRETGAVMYGTDPSEWACQWYDVIQLFLSEEIRIKDAVSVFQQET